MYACAYAIQVVFPWKGWLIAHLQEKKPCSGHIEHVQASSLLPYFLRSAEGRTVLKTLRSFKKLPGLLQPYGPLRHGTMLLVLSGVVTEA